MTTVDAPPQPLVPVPTPPPTRHAPPRATIRPDTEKRWILRAAPVVLSHWVTFSAALVTSLVSLVITMQLPDVLNQAISQSLALRRTPLSHYVWETAILGVVAGVAGLVARQLMMRVAYAIESDLRNILYAHLSRMSFSFYDRHQSGQLMSRANSDIRAVQMYLTFGPFIVVQCLGAFIAFGFMLSINVPLAFVSMATIPFVSLSAVRMRRGLQPASWLIQSRLAEVATIVDENINGVRVVKSFAGEDRELRSLRRAADRLAWAYVKDADLRARFTPVVQNLSQLGLVFVLLLGGYEVIHGHLGVGAILAFSSYIVMLQAPFQMLGMLVMMGQRAGVSAQRVYELLDEQPSVADAPDATDLLVADGTVHYRDASFSYPDGPLVLDGFDLELHRGETVALVGRTGSGKSTVGRLLSRFYDLSGGSVTIDGQDVREVTLTSLRAAVGVVMEEPFLFSASLRDNIAYGVPQASDAQVRAAATAAGADAFIEELPDGYATVVGERGYTLSGGQRQRVALARTLLVEAPIVVLDDATSSVDVEVEAAIHDALREHSAERTVLLIAHRLSTISLADRVVVLDGGRVVASGTHAELLATSSLYGEILAQAAGEPT